MFESGVNGAAAIRQAAAAAVAEEAALTVVTLAGQDPGNRCCGPSPHAFNCAVREAAQEALGEAQELLGGLATRATCSVLAGEPEPPLVAWVAERGFDVVLVPRRRLVRGGHWAARKLRRAGTAEVRLVG